MDSQQLLDSLTDHLALYHRSRMPCQNVTSPRSSVKCKVMQWLSGLSVEQRKATLTIVDPPWVVLLLQMQQRLEKEGPGYFFVLPDVPASELTDGMYNEDSKSRPQLRSLERSQDRKNANSRAQRSSKQRKRMAAQTSSNSGLSSQATAPLPSLCFRRAKGLLKRLDKQQAANALLCRNLQLFSSHDGELVASEFDGLHPLDSLSVGEQLVRDLDEFLSIMDEVTTGKFLDSSPSGAFSWEEMPWLKAMGYYSLPAFVANKLELAVWSAWIHSQGIKYPVRTSTGAIAKEFRLTGRSMRAWNDTQPSALTSSVCRTRKGFLDWWSKENRDVKSRAVKYALAEAAKMEVVAVTRCYGDRRLQSGSQQLANLKTTECSRRVSQKMYCSDSDSDKQVLRVYDLRSSCLYPLFSGLKALKQISASLLQSAFFEGEDGVQGNDRKWLVYSSLDSANTLSDRITRRVRNTLIKVMKDSMELELLGNQNRLDQSVCNHAKDGDAKGKKEKKRRKSRNPAQSKLLSEPGNGFTPFSSKPQSHVSKEGDIENKIHLKLELPTGQQKTAAWGKGKKKKRGTSKPKAAKESCLITPPSEGKGGNISCFLDQGIKQNFETEFTYSISNCVDLKSVSSFTSSNSQEPHLLQSAESSDSHSVNLHTASLSEPSYVHTPVRIEDASSTTPKTDSLVSVCISKSESSFPLTIDCNILSSTILPENMEAQETKSNDIRFLSQTTALETSITDLTVKNLRVKNSSIPFQGIESNNHSVKQSHQGCQQSNRGIENEKLAKLETCNVTKVPSVCASSSGSIAAAPCGSSCSSPTVGGEYLTCSKGQSWQTLHSTTFGMVSSHEWPGLVQVHSPGAKAQILPAATERLHLDVGKNWQRLQTSLVALRTSGTRQQSGPASLKRGGVAKINARSLDWPPTFNSGYNFAQRMGYSFSYREESAFIPFTQSPFLSGFGSTDSTRSGRAQDDLKNEDKTPEDTDYDESNYFSGDFDDHDGYLKSEEEGERHFVELGHHLDSDYNRIFGGGVMYWNTADYAGTGYSRPPSLSSEDSSWARHEADVSVVLDDVLGFSSMSGSFANGGTPNVMSTSPPTVSCHSGFDHGVATINPRLGLPRSGSELSGKFSATGLTVKTEGEQSNGSQVVPTLGVLDEIGSEIVPRPVLRPIIVRDRGLNMQLSLSDSSRRQEARSPHVARGRRELPRWKRPPSPVLRCVPPAPPPPPPSPVGGFRKRRGVTAARSGSSSPRHWGLANWPNKEELDGKDMHMKAATLELSGTAWRGRSITNTPPLHPISGTLLRERLVALPPLALEQEHPDAALPMQTTLLFNSNPALEPSITKLHSILHEEIEAFCKQVAAENLLRKPFINTAVKKVAHVMQVLWPRSRLKIFGSTATGLALPCSDVDLVVCLPPVRNLEPIKEAGILEGRNGIKETCLQQAARYLADQDWVKTDSLKTIENTAIPIIMLIACVPSHPGNLNDADSLPHYVKEDLNEPGDKNMKANAHTIANCRKDGAPNFSTQSNRVEKSRGPWGGKLDRELVRLDISFEASSHSGLRTAELVRELIGQFPAIIPLALVLRQFLMDRGLDHPYTGGLSSYCLVLLIARFLQHQHHLGWPFQQNFGNLLMDFLHFFGCVFDPRQMGICIRGGGMYLNRDRGHSIDPLHIEDPLHPSNNVGRNCFRILQCSKAFSDAYCCLEKELAEVSESMHFVSKGEHFRLLQKILPSIVGL